VNWVVGVVVGTALIAVTSPLFVRSYAPLHADSVRGVWTLPSGTTYRWRSEGYANTQIGPLGMPGKTSLGNPSDNKTRVALWGDSQAEGVCVDDEEKIFAQAERLSQGTIEVLPLARSGEDVADWLTQFPAVEKELDIDVHVLLIVDLPDLLTTFEVPVSPPSEADTAQAKAAIAAMLPAFVIQAARHLLTEEDGAKGRKLRFSVGPVPNGGKNASERVSDKKPDWLVPIADVRRATDRPIVLLYAPKSPQIIGGKVVMRDLAADDFAKVQAAAAKVGVQVIDVRRELRESAVAGIWPHGFHNGLIGSGHLNATGNRITASGLVDAIKVAIEQGN
jgi:hypothetical protein